MASPALDTAAVLAQRAFLGDVRDAVLLDAPPGGGSGLQRGTGILKGVLVRPPGMTRVPLDCPRTDPVAIAGTLVTGAHIRCGVKNLGPCAVELSAVDNWTGKPAEPISATRVLQPGEQITTFGHAGTRLILAFCLPCGKAGRSILEIPPCLVA